MRDRYTGDQRDRIKWGAIVDLVQRNPKIRHLLHVQMLREEDAPILLVDGDERPLHPDVWRALSDASSQNERLSEAIGDLKIESWAVPFTPAFRTAYFDRLCEHVAGVAESKVVFLDPDTGIQPASGAKAEHVRAEEIADAWEALARDDWLAVYQHARRDQTWERKTRRALSGYCQGATVTVYRGKQPLTQDVAIMAAQK